MYGKSFFKDQNEGSRISASEIVPLILALTHAKSVIDVGCGIGTWLAEFKKNHVKEIWGIDGEYIDRAMLQIPIENFLAKDLNKPLKINRQFDLAICLEVGEHLKEEYSKTLVNSLTKLAPIIVFSAAIPFQEGTNHINKQWQEYWANLFQSKNYIVIDCIRRKIWKNDNVEWWYRQNILMYVDKKSLEKYPLLEKEVKYTFLPQLSLVHPANYEFRANIKSVIKSSILRNLNTVLDKIKI